MTAVQPRAVGTGRLCVRADSTGKTRLRDLRQSGSTKLVFPHSHSQDSEVILVNTAGGITGGDQFDLEISAQTGAQLTLTTQAAERAYRAQPGEIGQVTSRLTVQTGAALKWLPQELILFDRCALNRRLDIALQPGADLLLVEPVVFGRTAMGETLRDVMFRDRITITRAGSPLYLDGMDLCGDATAHLARPAIANGAAAMASVVMVNAGASNHLGAVRALLPETAGASMLAQDVLVIRQLAVDSFELRRSLIPVLELLSHNALPKSWRL
jgi:urease accessory protein